MVIITTALRSEAKPILQTLSLKRDHAYPDLSLFRREEYTLLVTGVGKARTEETLRCFLKSQSNPQQIFLLNVGIAGGDRRFTKIGQMYLVHKIVEAATGRIYFPDILLTHPLDETSLMTVEEIDTRDIDSNIPLVDLEAVGIWKVASKYLPPHRMLFLKIVSDYRDGTCITTTKVQALIQQNIPAVFSIIESCRQPIFYDREILTPEEKKFLTEFRQALRLTDTQYLRLVNLSEGYKVIHEMDIFSVLKPLIGRTFVHKRERNQHFHALCELLTT